MHSPEMAVRAGHRCSSFLQSRWFDSIDCYVSRPTVEALHAKITGSSPVRSTPTGRCCRCGTFLIKKKTKVIVASLLGREQFSAAPRAAPGSLRSTNEALHANKVGSNPARSTKRVVRRWNGIFPVKEKTFGSFCGFDTRAQSIFLAVPLVRQ